MFNYGDLINKFKFTHLPATRNTFNIGDDIQVECASRLWGVRNYVERDDFKTWKSDMVIPFFGWYGYDTCGIPPESNCVLVSFHLCTFMMKLIAENANFQDWLKNMVKQQGFPAITRDIATMQYLRNLKIDSEFGGCLTQTLEPYTGFRNSDVIAVDAPPDISKMCDYSYSQHDESLIGMSYEDRLKRASDKIELFKNSKHVHTSKLHVYLPCKALNTPVTFYNYNIYQPHRLSGLIN